ncbi:hypothetical protein KUTeg_003834 [Tegillarca granosa]|uniref:Uncharacterized protein n=1 Tax=Tegillarca granosa TaxID=220873 RepID=A0ABQ9FNB8_TEGGR|nr:hypothetical protein KUTeg_003834 [Tegillarca granosa]
MYCSPGALTSASFALDATALGSIALAIATNHWLITNEATGMNFEVNENTTMFLKFELTSRIGLWRWCTSNVQDYLRGLKTEKIDGQTTSASIGEAQMGATPVFIIGLLFMVVATVTSIVGNFKADIRTLIASILYINGGNQLFISLCLAIGIILYITFVNDEASHHTNTPFSYHYGWSAYLVGLSFVTSEAAAVVGIYLFMSRHSKPEDMVKIIPGLEEKLKIEPASTQQERGHDFNTLIL